MGKTFLAVVVFATAWLPGLVSGSGVRVSAEQEQQDLSDRWQYAVSSKTATQPPFETQLQPLNPHERPEVFQEFD